ncbi:hypothetical protein BpHYR1_023656 [Brachionus plicatilis]|uniref:Uncharacterized protein n=1 Tax=Brachionus plicatilis TaxID=10195 RepID=A0A3M7STI6_BRAPC|nr:hypothetical protein BpHYR1_023656 [Brachionus plicatilis]
MVELKRLEQAYSLINQLKLTVDGEDQVSDDEFDYVQLTLQEFVNEYESKSETSDEEDDDAPLLESPSSTPRIPRSSTFT